MEGGGGEARGGFLGGGLELLRELRGLGLLLVVEEGFVLVDGFLADTRLLVDGDILSLLLFELLLGFAFASFTLLFLFLEDPF